MNNQKGKGILCGNNKNGTTPSSKKEVKFLIGTFPQTAERSTKNYIKLPPTTAVSNEPKSPQSIKAPNGNKDKKFQMVSFSEIPRAFSITRLKRLLQKKIFRKENSEDEETKKLKIRAKEEEEVKDLEKWEQKSKENILSK